MWDVDHSVSGSCCQLRTKLKEDIRQEPLLLEMSIRENLDIEGTKTDSEIWEALEKTGVKELIEQLPGKLDHQATTHVKSSLLLWITLY